VRLLPASLLLFVLVTAAPAAARTWRVERDGSGDATTIQPAIDQAAPGDTILIGPGRYTEYQTVTLEGDRFTTDVYVLVNQDSLTIMGTSRDDVIIGPDVAAIIGSSPKGIVFDTAVAANVQSLTVRYAYSGMRTRTTASIRNCAFVGCSYGLSGLGEGTLEVRDCLVTGCTGVGLVAFYPVREFIVENCVFDSNVYGLDAVSVLDARVLGCRFTGGVLGIQYEQGTTGIITDCTITDTSISAIRLSLGAGADIQRVYASSLNRGIYHGGSYLTGTNCIVQGGTGAAILGEDRNVMLHNCHILRGTGRLVELWGPVDPPDDHWDMRYNYWGTADRDSIAAWIWDGNDDPDIHGFVDFVPASPVPLPTEKKSLGSVKSLYKR